MIDYTNISPDKKQYAKAGADALQAFLTECLVNNTTVRQYGEKLTKQLQGLDNRRGINIDEKSLTPLISWNPTTNRLQYTYTPVLSKGKVIGEKSLTISVNVLFQDPAVNDFVIENNGKYFKPVLW